jgi:hypothetical protein
LLSSGMLCLGAIALMMVAVSSSETSVSIYQVTRRTVQKTAIFILSDILWSLLFLKANSRIVT